MQLSTHLRMHCLAGHARSQANICIRPVPDFLKRKFSSLDELRNDVTLFLRISVRLIACQGLQLTQ
jgi:hypothetical protein